MKDIEILKLLSVPLTRDKQYLLEDELQRYGAATNWVVKQILKQGLPSRRRVIEVLEDEFSTRFDTRHQYLEDVVITASAEIVQHRKLAKSVRSMREKIPYFRPSRLIFSQPIVRLDEKAVTLTLSDGNELPIPFDKRSRNRLADKISSILKGAKEGEVNRNYGRIRITWNKEGFADIDIRAMKGLS